MTLTKRRARLIAGAVVAAVLAGWLFVAREAAVPSMRCGGAAPATPLLYVTPPHTASTFVRDRVRAWLARARSSHAKSSCERCR